MIFISMKKGCMNYYFQTYSLKLNISGGIVKMCYFQAIIGIQRKYQLSITHSDKRLQAIQYENIGLQGAIRNSR